MGEEHQDTRLHRYFDGDLPADEAAALRARIESTPELRAKLDGLAEVRAVVRESVAPALLDLPSDDLWARIEAEIDANGAASTRSAASAEGTAGAETAEAPERAAPPPERLRAIEGGAAARRKPAPPASADPARRRRVAGIVIAGLALAAAVLLLVIRPGETDPSVDEGAIASGDDVGGEAPETAEDIVFRTEVLAVDFGENSGAIFSVEGDDGESYSVVWLADVQPKETAVE